MCGISGYLDLDHGVDTAVLRQMNDVIVHRGPDDEGYALIGPASCSFCRGRDTIPEVALPPLEHEDGSRYFLGFGHRRLSIVDLTASGHQPMSLANRDLVVTYNGEIYNYLELRDELTSLGYIFHTTCDTEVLLYAYCQWGEDCLTHFNGMWGFALWDGQQNKLFCARDRLGAKPFHYWHQGNRFLFGSELKQLCQAPSIPHHFNEAYLSSALIYSWSDYSDETFIQGFHNLRPGHKLVLQLSGDCRSIDSVQAVPYWTLDTTYQEGVSLEKWKELVAEEFSRSCRWRLRSDAPLAALLSGGLDSSCIVTEVCRQLDDPSLLETFTTSYPGQDACDEWQFADLINQTCGCRGNRFFPDPSQGIEERYEDVLWHAEGLANVTILGLKTLLDELHRRGYKVVLNGQCGDETMFGYDWYYARFLLDLIKQGRLPTFLRSFQSIVHHSSLSAPRLLQGLMYYNSPHLRDGVKVKHARSFVADALIERREWDTLYPLMCPSSMQDLQLRGLTSISLPPIVRRDDRLYMSASLESRLPFMDYRFVELAAKIPPELKIREGYTKRIMRDVFNGRMPDAITWRTDKRGFEAPGGQWQKAFSQEYLADRVKNAKSAAYFKMDRLGQLVETTPSAPEIFQFLQIEQFARRFDVN